MGNRNLTRLIQATLMTPVFFSTVSVATELEEIVVTAERRVQNIQDVPLSIAAIAGDDVNIGKVTELNDVAFTTPGLTFNEFNLGEPRIYIRGIGNGSDSAASDPAVGVFLDEVYIGRTGGVGFDLYDLERVEILRGPQGTLYGKNTNGGAINIVTARPSKDNQLKVGASIGNHGTYQLQALLNGALTDSVSGKLVVSAKQRDGYGKNVITEGEIVSMGNLANSTIIGPSIGAAGSGRRLDDAKNLSVRGQLLFDLSDSAQLLLGADIPIKAANIMQEGLDSGVVESTETNWRILAQAWQLAQEDEQAIPAMVRAASLIDNGEVDLRLAQSYQNLARYEECVDSARTSMQKGELRREDQANMILGACLFELGEFGPARTAFEAARRDNRSQQNANAWIEYVNIEEDRERQLAAALGR